MGREEEDIRVRIGAFDDRAFHIARENYVGRAIQDRVAHVFRDAVERRVSEPDEFIFRKFRRDIHEIQDAFAFEIQADRQNDLIFLFEAEIVAEGLDFLRIRRETFQIDPV